jgi:hypothetical protein
VFNSEIEPVGKTQMIPRKCHQRCLNLAYSFASPFLTTVDHLQGMVVDRRVFVACMSRILERVASLLLVQVRPREGG